MKGKMKRTRREKGDPTLLQTYLGQEETENRDPTQRIDDLLHPSMFAMCPREHGNRWFQLWSGGDRGLITYFYANTLAGLVRHEQGIFHVAIQQRFCRLGIRLLPWSSEQHVGRLCFTAL
jgi:hypothetical protein